MSTATTPAIHAKERPPCTTPQQSWSCKNMKAVPGDMSMDYEYYKCDVCGKTMNLDYEEMK